MLLRLPTVLLAICLATIAAHADTYSDFSLSGRLTNGATLSGTIHYDFSNAFGSSVTYTSLLNGTSTDYNFQSVADGYYGAATHTVSFGYSNYAGALKLFFAGNGTFGSLCTEQAVCSIGTTQYISGQATGTGAFIDFVSDVAAPAITPEPSSFILLGTGILAMAGAVKRRFA